MDCKKALEEANGDLDTAGDILRKKGIVKAAKRADKISAEGLSAVEAKGSTAVALELNTETDFAAGSDDFKNYLRKLLNIFWLINPLLLRPVSPASKIKSAPRWPRSAKR